MDRVSKLKIAMIVSNRYDPDPRVRKEAEALSQAGHQVSVYAFDRMGELEEHDQSECGVTLHRIRTVASPIGNLLATALGLTLFRAKVCKLLAEAKPDVVHCHDQDTCGVGAWWKAAGHKLAGKDKGLFIYDAHDLYWTFLTMPNPTSKWRRAGSALLKAQCYGFVKLTDLVITVTEGDGGREGLAEIFKRWGARTEVVWNAPELPERVPPLPDSFVVGYVGTVREPEMFRWLVDALEILPEERRPGVLVAGCGVAEVEVARMLTEASERLGFPLELHGRFGQEDLYDLYSRTSVQFCVYPTGSGNVDRAIPVKMLESVAYGRAVIGNADTLMAEHIERNKWGLTVSEGDSGAIATAILELITMGSEIRSSDSQSVVPSWEHEGASLVDIYRGLEI